MKVYNFLIKMMCVGIIAMLMVSISGCNNSRETKQCLNDIKVGLQNRLDIPVSNDSFEGMKQSYSMAIDEELKSIGQYKSIEFEDKEFQTLILKYISALECEKEAVNKYFFDNAEFKSRYYDDGRDICVGILQNFIENYKFSVDKQYSDKMNKYMNNNNKRIDLGETVTVAAENGEISIAIEGFSITDWKKYADFSDLDERENVGLLKCAVKNNNYYDKYNAGFVNLGDFISICDSNCISVIASGTSYETGKYEPFGAEFGELQQGEKKQIAIPYIYNVSEKMVYIHIGQEYSLFLKIE